MELEAIFVDEKGQLYVAESNWVKLDETVVKNPPDARVHSWVRYHAVIRFLRERNIRHLFSIALQDEMKCPFCQSPLAAYACRDSEVVYLFCSNCGRLLRTKGIPVTPNKEGLFVIASDERKSDVQRIVSDTSLPFYSHLPTPLPVLQDAVRKWIADWVDWSTITQLDCASVLRIADGIIQALTLKGILPASLSQDPSQDLSEAVEGGNVGRILAQLGGVGNRPAGISTAPYLRLRSIVAAEFLYSLLILDTHGVIKSIFCANPQLVVMALFPYPDLFSFLYRSMRKFLLNKVFPTVQATLSFNHSLSVLLSIDASKKIVALCDGIKMEIADLTYPCIVKVTERLQFIPRLWEGGNEEREMEIMDILSPQIQLVETSVLIDIFVSEIGRILEQNFAEENQR